MWLAQLLGDYICSMICLEDDEPMTHLGQRVSSFFAHTSSNQCVSPGRLHSMPVSCTLKHTHFHATPCGANRCWRSR